MLKATLKVHRNLWGDYSSSTTAVNLSSPMKQKKIPIIFSFLKGNNANVLSVNVNINVNLK
jgi:hypothetical protein